MTKQPVSSDTASKVSTGMTTEVEFGAQSDQARKEARLAERYARIQNRSEEATVSGAAAFNRLLELAESRDSGQIGRIALFIGACWNGNRHFDRFDLRSLDVSIGDDMIAVLDAVRWGQADIGRMVEGGDARIRRMLELWGMFGDGQTGQVMAFRR